MNIVVMHFPSDKIDMRTNKILLEEDLEEEFQLTILRSTEAL